MLIDHGFENIKMPPSLYDVIARGSPKQIKTIQSSVTWRAIAQSYAKDKRAKDIIIYIYFRFNAQHNEITIQFRVVACDTEAGVPDVEKLKILDKFDQIKPQIEKELTEALRIYGVWASSNFHEAENLNN